jgi:TonB family protein
VPSPPRARRATAVARAAAPARPAAAPAPAAPPAAEAPVDMTGVTLTSDGSGAWASAVGNGAAMAGPLPAYRGRPRAAAQARGGGAGDGARVVDLADLARKPEPPALTGALERAYPAEARRLGLSGEAVVKARVRPDGAIDRARVVSATDGWFGDACRRVLVASRWSPPVDRGGAPCATEIRYVCHFEVAR